MSLPKELILRQIEIGPLRNFIYFIGDAKTKEIAVVDPAWDVPLLCREAKRHGYAIKAVFLTHGHPDHVNGLKEILSLHNVPACISKHEASFYKPVHKNIFEVDDRQKLKIGGLEFECILTPGHTPGCQSFRCENILLTGDAVFVDGCGRCDLPGGDARVMYHTLYKIILPLPDSTVIYPGHNYGPAPSATLKEQKLTNPYLQCSSLEEFLAERMGMVL